MSLGKYTKLFLCLSLLFIGVFTSCKQNKNQPASQTTKDTLKKEPEIVYDRKWNDLALYLGGLEPKGGGAYDSLSSRSEFKIFQKMIDPAWKLKDSILLRPLEKWTTEAHKNEINSEQTVLYPFSGPDFVTLHTLFPNAKDYVMFGLEIEGNPPQVDKIPKDRLPQNLGNLANSVMDNLKDSFFYTLDMSSDLYISDLKGTTPILLLMMARMNREVLEVKPIKIDNLGAVQYRPENDSIKMMADDTVATGIEIKFRKAKNEPVQTLRYFCVNAMDPFLSKTNSVQKYIRSLAPTISYIKSASYLMHRSDFTVFRNLLMEVSGSITQDDTGIAYKFFDKNTWNFSYYGRYIAPIPMFRSYYQQDYSNAFQAAGVSAKAVNFDMGYKSSTNLIIARKGSTTVPQDNKKSTEAVKPNR